MPDKPKFSWYTGLTLLELFVKYQRAARTDPLAYNMLCKAKMKFQVYAQYYILGIGAVLCGRVLSKKHRLTKDIQLTKKELFIESQQPGVFY